jgi:hypothetical protein
MHPAIPTILGLIGMSGCLWYLNDIARVAYMECASHIHRITITRFAEAHVKAMTKSGSIDLTMEELTETAIEVVGPFLN